MKFWFDTEFIEDGRTIDLISIGIIAEDGREYYAENTECDLTKASKWVRDNVFPHLKPGTGKLRDEIAREIVEFVGPTPEFWAYYADYDWVALCQLYGTMLNLPTGWPMYCLDIKQLCKSVGNPKLEKMVGNEHSAIADAKWNKSTWERLIQLQPSSEVAAAYRRCANELRPSLGSLMCYEGDNTGDIAEAASNSQREFYADMFDNWATEAEQAAQGEIE